MVSMDYTVLVEAVLFLFLAVVYFYHKSRFVHIGCGLGLILMSFILDFPSIIIGIVAVSVAAISYFFLTERRKSMVMMGVLLLLFLLLSSYAFAADDKIKVDEVEKVKYVDEVLQVTSQPKLELMGTDYLPFDNGKLMSFISVGEYPVSNASCFVSVLYPDMSYFIQNYLMNRINKPYFVGGHYLDFVVPNVTGVYPVNAHCFYNSSPIRDNVVFMESDFEIEYGSIIDLLQFDDDSHIQFKGSGDCKNINCSVDFVIPMPVGFHDEFLTDFRNDIEVWTDKDRTFRVYVYDWDKAANHYLFNFTKNLPVNPANFQNELNDSHVSPNSTIVISIQAYNFDGGKMRVYYNHIDRVYNGSYINDLRGNGEIVVSKGLYNISVEVSGDIEFIDSDTAILILMLVVVLFLLFVGKEDFAGIILAFWTIIYAENIYMIILFLLLSVVMVWWGVSRRKEK